MDSLCLLKPEDLSKMPFLEGISARYIRAKSFIPLEFKENTLKIVMADPRDRDVVDALSAAFAAAVVVYRGEAAMIDDYISRYYSQEFHNMNKVISNIYGGVNSPERRTKKSTISRIWRRKRLSSIW